MAIPLIPVSEKQEYICPLYLATYWLAETERIANTFTYHALKDVTIVIANQPRNGTKNLRELQAVSPAALGTSQ